MNRPLADAAPIPFLAPLSERIRRVALVDAAWIPWAIIAVGIVLRLVNYLMVRSMWIDEVLIGDNILNRSYAELFQPLDDNQAAPIGFLLVMKLAVDIFGNNELAFRLFPMIAGIASLFLFRTLLQKVVPGRAGLVALVLFAISVPLISYANEAKQYSIDAAVAIIVCLVAVLCAQGPLTWRKAVALAATGTLALWFSHPAMFVVAGAGLALGLAVLMERDWARLRRLVPVGLVIGVSFAAVYVISVQHVAASDFLRRYWAGSLLSNLTLSFDTVEWAVNIVVEAFRDPVVVSTNDVGLLLFLVGVATLFARQRVAALILLLPIVLALGAAIAGRYPFGDRLILFIVPPALALIGEGVRAVVEQAGPRLPALPVVALALLFVQPIQQLVEPYNYREDIKPVMEYVSTHRLPGDKIYVYYFSHYPYSYYMDRYRLSPADTIIGRSWINIPWVDRRGIQRINYMADINRVRNNRYVWFIFTTIHTDRRMYLSYLDSIGRRVDEFQATNAYAYLYDFSGS